MKRYAVFTARFVLAPMISGTFLVTATGGASWLEWAHVVTGFVTIYLIMGLLLIAAKNRQIRLQASVALAAGLLEAIPGMPQLHAFVSPVLFATLAWAVMGLHSGHEKAQRKSRRIFVLPALVLAPIYYGVGYRHLTSGFVPHIAAALGVAGLLLCVCMVLNERHPGNKKLRRACNLTMAVVLFQVVFGIAAFVIRLLEIEGGLWLAVARTAHITGAALLLAASTELAIQYRRSAVGQSGSTGPAAQGQLSPVDATLPSDQA